MKRNHTEKAAELLIDSASKHDWNDSLFVGYVLAAPPIIQRAIIRACVLLFKTYKDNAENPHLSWRVDREAYEDIKPIDLTEFDEIR